MDGKGKTKYEEPRTVRLDQPELANPSIKLEDAGSQEDPIQVTSSKTQVFEKIKDTVDNSELRQILRSKISEYREVHDPEEGMEEKVVGICVEKIKMDDRKDQHLDEEHLVQKLFEASQASLWPNTNKKSEASSSAATYNSSKRSSLGSNVPSITSTEAENSFTVSSDNSLQSSGSSGINLTGDSDLEHEGSDSSVRSRSPSATVHRGISQGKSSTAKQRLDQKATGKEQAAKEGTSARRDYIFATESAEYIKRDPDFVIPGPNPKRVPHDEVMNAVNGLNNMFLAHEISLREDFRLQRYAPPPESLEGRVQIQLKRAYWDLFAEAIQKDPPEYLRVLGVFDDVKQTLLNLLLPHNNKTRREINEILDMDHISKLMTHDAFTYDDFYKYSRFIIDILAKLCCPVRDSDIAALRKLNNPVEIFREIFDVADKMKVDIANYYIQQFRPTIMRQCAQYERSKFAGFLEVERRLGEDGLRTTRNWLSRHKLNREDNATVLAKAFVELLGVNYNYEVPETLAVDFERYRLVSRQILRLAVLGAITLTVGAHAQSMLPNTPNDLRDTLKRDMKILISDDDMTDEKKFNDSILRAAEQCMVIVEGFVKANHTRRLTSEEKKNIHQCVNELHNPENKVRGLIFRRIIEYTEEILISQYKYHVPVPAGLFAVRIEVMSLIGDYAQVVLHNRSVFGDLYMAILENKIGCPKSLGSDEFDPEFQKVLDLLHEHDALERASTSTQQSATGITTSSS